MKKDGMVGLQDSERAVGMHAKRRSARSRGSRGGGGGGNNAPDRPRSRLHSNANTHSSPMLPTRMARLAVDEQDLEQNGLRDSQLTRYELSDLLQNLEQHVNSLDLTNSTSGRRSEGERRGGGSGNSMKAVAMAPSLSAFNGASVPVENGQEATNSNGAEREGHEDQRYGAHKNSTTPTPRANGNRTSANGRPPSGGVVFI